MIAIGFACYGIGFFGVGVTTWIGAVAVTAMFAGVGIGLCLPSVDAALSEQVSRDYRAGAFSLRNSTTFLGRFGGPITFTGLAETVGIGYSPLLLSAGVIAVGAAILTAVTTSRSWVSRRTRLASPEK